MGGIQPTNMTGGLSFWCEKGILIHRRFTPDKTYNGHEVKQNMRRKKNLGRNGIAYFQTKPFEKAEQHPWIMQNLGMLNVDSAQKTHTSLSETTREVEDGYLQTRFPNWTWIHVLIVYIGYHKCEFQNLHSAWTRHLSIKIANNWPHVWVLFPFFPWARHTLPFFGATRSLADLSGFLDVPQRLLHEWLPPPAEHGSWSDSLQKTGVSLAMHSHGADPNIH